MANYKSKFTGKQIDEAVSKALARVGGYEETVVKPMFDVTVEVGINKGVRIEMPYRLEVGKVYPVTVNGVTHEVECATADGMPSLMGFDGNIYDYAVDHGNATGNNNWSITVYDTDEHPEGTECRVTIDIPVEEKVVHTIEPKFLPGVCLPVVDFTDWASGEITDEATIQLLNELADSRTPFILKYSFAGRMYISSFMDFYGNTDDETTFNSTYGSPAARIRKNSGVWSFNIDTGA